MTKEDKELLLKDLCARLPYKPKVHIEHDVFYDEREPYDTELNLSVLYNRCAGMEIKPYLRPMSSMTEEEETYYWEEINENAAAEIPMGEIPSIAQLGSSMAIVIDWLNARHFDYRGLIEKGLALEANKRMYKF